MKPEIEAWFDYAQRHRRFAQDPGAKPVMVNEYAPQTPGHVWDQIVAARANGTVFHYWQGSHTTQQRQNILAKMKGLITGEVVEPPHPVPSQCPWLVRWGSHILHTTNAGHQLTPGPVRGGFVVIDSTPRFSHDVNDPRGRPCNSEHPGCGGRDCEDPRGPLWEQVAGPAVKLKVDDNPFLLRVGPLSQPGHYAIQVCPRPDARDGEEGKPLRLGPSPCSTTEWTVP
jgi:hypothetical protein